MLVNFYYIGVVAFLTGTVVLLRHVFFCRAFPSAPGPKLAALTHFWYLSKVWMGHFEEYEIQQHEAERPILRVAPQMYSIDDPTAMDIIYGLGSDMPKTAWYEAWGDPRVPNHNLFSTRDRKFHAGMRKKAGSMYSMTSMKAYEPHINNCIAVLLTKFDEIADQKRTIDLQRWMQCYAFDTIGEITFGSRVGFLESDCKDIDGIMRSLDINSAFSTLFGISRRLLPLWLLMYGFPILGLLKWIEKLNNLRKSKQNVRDDGAETFYDKLQVAQEKSHEDYVFYHMDVALVTNMAAGSDNTGISLTAVLYNIIRQPSIYMKLRNEILDASARGEASQPITFDQAQKLPYLDLVIKEALRIHPATGLPMWREVQAPGVTIAGQHSPKGSVVGINPWVAHRNKTVFGMDADQFRPERWDPKSTSQEKLSLMEKYHIPFGAGTRSCVGKNISLMEMIKLVPELVRRYDFELLSDELKFTNYWFVKQGNVLAKVRRSNI